MACVGIHLLIINAFNIRGSATSPRLERYTKHFGTGQVSAICGEVAFFSMELEKGDEAISCLRIVAVIPTGAVGSWLQDIVLHMVFELRSSHI